MIVANEMSETETSESSISNVSSSSIRIPTGVFANGNDFVRVYSDWVRIVINGQRAEYDIRSAEPDNWENCAIVLSNGDSMTIYKGGRSLYYDGTTYYKK